MDYIITSSEPPVRLTAVFEKYLFILLNLLETYMLEKENKLMQTTTEYQ